MAVKTYASSNQILGFVMPHAALSILVNDAGVTADPQTGKKIIPAGTPVGGPDTFYENEQTVLSVVSDATAKGVLQHDVDVTSGQGNGSLLIFGFVNENRLADGVTIPDAVKTALNGKVTFFRRNN
ncbi:hypothetical protein [Schleiferilactobacillus shenzhenensis]|uniref:hypothetical protein n=1 Tax=Schleiferilactobacillus shenzhenensis TaxID=1231337 RepID=UPI0004100C8A|nr:hypothetical protein [Schleiferilactobacillus shenzhenensis]